MDKTQLENILNEVDSVLEEDKEEFEMFEIGMLLEKVLGNNAPT